MNYDNYVYIIGSCLSIICVISLVTSWCLLPRWRTLQNYISINQIITATVHLIGVTAYHLMAFDEDDDTINHPLTILNIYTFLITLCWSLCSSFVAYIRLVLVYCGHQSYEKRQTTIFTYVVVILVKGVTDWLIPKLLNLNRVYKLVVNVHLMFMIMLVILIIFVRIVMSVLSCCKHKMSKRNITHIISLIGVALICDSTLISYLFVAIFYGETLVGYICKFLFCHRIVFQTIFVLCRSSSRLHWANYIRKRRNNHLNNRFLNMYQLGS